MIRLFAAAVLVAAAPVAAAERTFRVGAFDKLALEGSPEVVVTTGRAVGVHATGDAEMLDRLDVRVEGGVLKIGHKRDGGELVVGDPQPDPFHDHRADAARRRRRRIGRRYDRPRQGPRLRRQYRRVGVAPRRSARRRRGELQHLGVGDDAAAGRCGTGSAKIAGSGDLKLAALKCATLSASIAGSGSIDAYATQTATLATMGSGDIRLAGGARCTVSSAGSGKAHCS